MFYNIVYKNKYLNSSLTKHTMQNIWDADLNNFMQLLKTLLTIFFVTN